MYLNQHQNRKTNYSQRFFNNIKCHKDFSTLKLYTFKALLSKKSILYPFTHPLTHTNPTIYWDVTLLALILHLTLFKCIQLFITLLELFAKSYIDQEHILMKNIFRNNSFTHFLSFISIRNIKKMQEKIHLKLYHTL